jgi:hypothetical protein
LPVAQSEDKALAALNLYKTHGLGAAKT